RFLRLSTALVALSGLCGSASAQVYTLTAQNRTVSASNGCPGANCMQQTASAPDFMSWTGSAGVQDSSANQTSGIGPSSFSGSTRAFAYGNFATASSQLSLTFTPMQYLRYDLQVNNAVFNQAFSGGGFSFTGQFSGRIVRTQEPILSAGILYPG